MAALAFLQRAHEAVWSAEDNRNGRLKVLTRRGDEGIGNAAGQGSDEWA